MECGLKCALLIRAFDLKLSTLAKCGLGATNDCRHQCYENVPDRLFIMSSEARNACAAVKIVAFGAEGNGFNFLPPACESMILNLSPPIGTCLAEHFKSSASNVVYATATAGVDSSRLVPAERVKFKVQTTQSGLKRLYVTDAESVKMTKYSLRMPALREVRPHSVCEFLLVFFFRTYERLRRGLVSYCDSQHLIERLDESVSCASSSVCAGPSAAAYLCGRRLQAIKSQTVDKAFHLVILLHDESAFKLPMWLGVPNMKRGFSMKEALIEAELYKI
ncbi:hypothetical protein EVAR_6470_1 [Eumeta japonica]|uniref:Uncharacterized protein n=1 Tax=Eumeta variegata TaxID=151549 RepID=A0A4C1SSB6_EUMVA|nr:hypothetical protein EVAR_6470_1 [Eumeta japonica]